VPVERRPLPPDDIPELLEASEAVYHRRVTEIQLQTHETYHQLCNERVAIIMTQPDVMLETAQSTAVEEMEPVWRTLWRERCEQIEQETTGLALRNASLEERAKCTRFGQQDRCLFISRVALSPMTWPCTLVSATVLYEVILSRSARQHDEHAAMHLGDCGPGIQ
jgi:hypothetical protein